MASIGDLPRFHWADYLVFVLIILLSCVVGIYYAVKDKRAKKNTVEDFLLAGRSMSVFPVSMSMFVSWLSAISFIGDPVEVYYHGSVYVYIGLGYCLGIPLAAEVFAPRYHRMKLVSVYQFLEVQYGRSVRLIASFINMVGMEMYSGVALFAPAIALAQVTGIHPLYFILIIGTICIIYTSMGGMKAVLWVDTIQMGVMVVGIVVLIVRGTIVMGGVSNVWNLARDSGRINFNSFNPSPLVRSTFWTYVVGGYFRTFNPYTASQTWVQRYLSLPTERDVKRAIYMNIPLYFVFVSMFLMVGLLLVAYFHDCDPLLAGRIEKSDQIVSLMMMELLGVMPGLPGVFLACLFCASLSSMSSVQNSLATITLKDFIEPTYLNVKKTSMSKSASLHAAKVLSVLSGLLTISVAVFIAFLENPSVFQICLQATGATLGPISALFWLGMFVPFVNSVSALIGCLLSTLLGLWLMIGPMFSDVAPPDRLPVNINSCPSNESMYLMNSLNYTSPMDDVSLFTKPVPDSPSGLEQFYRFTPLLFNALGSISTVIISVTIGGISNLMCKKRPWIAAGSDYELCTDSPKNRKA